MGNTPPTSQETPTGVGDSFVGSFARLFVASALYPVGHRRLEKLADAAIRSVQPLLSSGQEVELYLKDGGFEVPPHTQVGELSAPEQRAFDDLDGLGIGRLVFRPGIERDEIVSLVFSLRDAVQNSFRGSMDWDVWFEQLSSNIQVELRDYGRPGDEQGGAGDADLRQRLLDEALKPLAKYRVGRSTVEQLRQYVERVLESVQRAAAQQKSSAGERGAKTDFEAIMPIVATALQGSIEDQLSKAGDTVELSEVFEELEAALSASLDSPAASSIADQLYQSTQELMLRFRRQIKGRRKRKWDEAARPKSTLTTKEVHEAVVELARVGHEYPDFHDRDRAEYFSVLFQYVVKDGVEEASPRLERRLHQVLEGVLTKRETTVVLGALVQLCWQGNAGLMDQVLPVIVAALRRTQQDAATRGLLFALGRATPDALRAVWPYLANELMVGLQAASEPLQNALLDIMARIPIEWMRADIRRLRNLEAIDSETVRPEIFDPPQRQLLPLYEVLLSLPGAGRTWEILRQAIRKHPREIPCLQAVLAFEEGSLTGRTLLKRLLGELNDGKDVRSLERYAASVLIAALQALPQARRREPWVLLCIEALGSLPNPDSERLLREIEARWWRPTVRRWPTRCREGASRALTELERLRKPRTP